jgi:hypothetical protein
MLRTHVNHQKLNIDDQVFGYLLNAKLSHGSFAPPCASILNYSNTDGNINILPTLQRIVEHKIPLWVFR